MHTNIVLTT